MCPVCLSTLAWIAAGTTSAGGLTALVVKRARGRASEARNSSVEEPR